MAWKPWNAWIPWIPWIPKTLTPLQFNERLEGNVATRHVFFRQGFRNKKIGAFVMKKQGFRNESPVKKT
jgi:hypothetical protein